VTYSTNIRRERYPHKTVELIELNSFVKRNVGDMCYVSSVSDDEDKIINIGIYNDEIVLNSETGNPSLRFKKYDNVFSAYLEESENNNYLVLPSSKEISKSFKLSRRSYTERSETNILESIGSKILKISQIQNQMNPIFEIVGSLLYLDRLFMSDFKTWGREKTSRYLDFLKSLNILAIEGDMIVSGDFLNKMDRKSSIEDMYHDILNQVVQKGMLMMFYSLNMTHLHPFIKLTNVNCMTSLGEGSALKWDWKGYQYYMQKIYRDRNNSEKLKIVSKAVELTIAGIFDKERNSAGDMMFYCEDNVFNNYLESCKYRPLAYD
jgi:hypothetical protein